MSAPSKMGVEGKDSKGKSPLFSLGLENTFSWPCSHPGGGTVLSCTSLESNKSKHSKFPGDLCCCKAVGVQISSRAPEPVPRGMIGR